MTASCALRHKWQIFYCSKATVLSQTDFVIAIESQNVVDMVFLVPHLPFVISAGFVQNILNGYLLQMRHHQQFWDWAEQTLSTALRAAQWYNGDWLPNQRGTIQDRVSRLMGYATMRQVRMKPSESKLVSALYATPTR